MTITKEKDGFAKYVRRNTKPIKKHVSAKMDTIKEPSRRGTMSKICEYCRKEYGGWHVFVRNIAGYAKVLTVLGQTKFKVKETGEIVGGKPKQICGNCLETKFNIKVARKW